ncbi:MAG: glycosyltransferase family 39 protein, partial [Chloroflexi bacterium]|nr:glycosyltransferase family 39 protein [Chloroflexota bacterium]
MAQPSDRSSLSGLGTPIFLGGTVLVGLMLRLYLLQASGWMIEGDEALIGLAARHILAGERPIFLYGQPYLGMLEGYLAALLFGLLGSSAVALKLVPLAFSLAFIVLTYCLGNVAFDRRVGLWAALLAAIPPVYCTVGELKAWGAYIETLVLGDLLPLIAWQLIYLPIDAGRKQERYLLLPWWRGWRSGSIGLSAIIWSQPCSSCLSRMAFLKKASTPRR